ncbi:MAG TPA: ferritin-like domain-containing protein [Arthrobacter sp.]
MKDDSTEISARRRYFRYAVFSLTALLVMSLGIALVPHQPPAPAETPFSERARAAAEADALALIAAGQELAGAAAGDGGHGTAAALNKTVTLLTIQARALMLPGGTPTASASTDQGPKTALSSSEGPPAPPGSSATSGPVSLTELATALSTSGSTRLTDALEADGGMARLLAGTGTAQLLAAEEVAAFAGVTAESLPGWQAPAAGSSAPAETTPAACPSAGASSAAASGGVGPDRALAAVVSAEWETVYGYQAALTRLDPASAAQASSLLAEHLDLADEAASLAAVSCAAVPPPQPGYVLDAAFLDAPAAGLARLEAGTLAVLGDLVALGDAPIRNWGVPALVAAARRTSHWGGDPGPLPGVPVDESELPQLPGAEPTPGRG